MASKLNSKIIRIDPKLLETFQQVRKSRLQKDLDEDPRKLTDAEISRMMLNTPSFQRMKLELSTLPRRKKR